MNKYNSFNVCIECCTHRRPMWQQHLKYIYPHCDETDLNGYKQLSK